MYYKHIFHDIYTDNLTMLSTVTAQPQENQIEKFLIRAKVDIFRNQAMLDAYKRYKYVKVNWFKYTLKSYCVYFMSDKSVTIGGQGPKEVQFYSPTFTMMNGKIPCYIVTNDNVSWTVNPGIDLIRDSQYSKKFYIGGKPISFYFPIPRRLRNYYFSRALAAVDPLKQETNNLRTFMYSYLGINNFKLPTHFLGGIGDWLKSHLPGTDLTEKDKFPMLFTFDFDVKVCCTFKNVQDLGMQNVED